MLSNQTRLEVNKTEPQNRKLALSSLTAEINKTEEKPGERGENIG